MKRILLFVVSIAFIATVITSASAFGRQSDAPQDSREAREIAAIRAVLDAQTAAWNRGEIEGFMEGYARSDETVFMSGDTIRRGWQTVLDYYKKGYYTREMMGALTFSDIEIKLISRDVAVALGRWELKRITDSRYGRFTLILRRTGKNWRIVHDHTSSAP